MMLYITYQNITSQYYMGVLKKIMAQCRVFERTFGKVYYTVYAGQTLYLMSDKSIVKKEFAVSKRVCNEILIDWLQKYKIQRTYIRYNKADIWFIDFLKKQKELDIRSILEINTYPYDGLSQRNSEEDKYYREELCKYINCCTTYAKYDNIFGISCIPLVNGIDVKEHKVKTHHQPKKDITLIAVAAMATDHGYERILKGMHEYYQIERERKVYFKLVGEGPVIPYYKRLVEEYCLKEFVIFCGFLQNEALDEAYDSADIGIGGLGCYKRGLMAGASIKMREYCVRGLPAVYGYDDIDFDHQYFGLKFSNDDTLVNIEDVLSFYDGLQDKDYIADMHNYAVKNCSWDKILEPVIKYFEEV